MGVHQFRVNRANACRAFGKDLFVCFALVAGIAAVFGGLSKADFINLDDFDYVKYNVHLTHGFTWDAIKWAFTPGYASNWHPLTWFSHMLDYKLFGLRPGAHHLMNVGFHAANSVVLFLFLRWLTNRFWPSALVTGLFAFHPLHVESVAWISERKDVLSTFFVLLCLWTYVAYARAKTSGGANSKRYYVASIGFFVLALMSKPMAVTAPCVMLLLDFWPLNRIYRNSRRLDDKTELPRASLWKEIKESLARFLRLCLEKIPFFVLCAAACAVTLVAQTQAISALEKYSIWARLANVPTAYTTYLRRMIWPSDLSILYPLVFVPWQAVVGSTLVLLTITFFAVRAVRSRPYLMAGWLWFLGTLVPVIGIVQVGSQRLADRYTYLPLVGIFIALAWVMDEIISKPVLRRGTYGAGVAVLISFACCSRYETGYWRDSVRLFDHGLLNTKNNSFLVSGMAAVLDDSGIIGVSKQVAFYYYWAFLLVPNDPKLNYNYGNFWAHHGDYEQALVHYEKALALKKDYPEAYFDKANALALLSRYSEAETNFASALRLRPDYVNAEVNFAGLYAIERQFDKAIPHYERAIQLAPHYADAHHLFGVTLARMGRMEEAVVEFRLAVQYWPEPDMTAWNDLAWMLAVVQTPSVHNPSEAVQLATTACELCNYDDAGPLDTLAVAYAEAGRFDDAIKISDKTIAIAKTKNRPDFLTEMERRKDLYTKHQPYRPLVVAEERPAKSMLDLHRRN